jgi:hypothetical protein
MTISSFALTVTPAAIFTSIGTSVVSVGYFCNIDPNGSQSFSLWLVQNGLDPGDDNIVYKDFPLTVGETLVIDREKIVLDNGDSVYANCSANISATLSTFSQ